MADEIDESRLREAARLLMEASYVVALTGAGMSVESGIPPFRGPGGIWTKYGEPPMDQYQQFLADPKKYWLERTQPSGPMAEFREVLLKASPNPGHYALAELESMGVVKSIITQNIDNLHQAAGSRNIIEIHGNATLLRCISCQTQYKRNEIPLDELPPKCPRCQGIVKYDTVMFGEPIPPDVLMRCEQETEMCDCMLVIGTSATVYPAAAFPQHVASRGHPLIEVNLYESALTGICRISLKGPSGEVLPKLVQEVRKLKS
jgi:NAD-dependent deacetylase